MKESPTKHRGEQPKVGVSACLLGDKVRYDGGHQLQPLIQEHLSPWLNFVSFCPESSAGLGTPRPPVNLIKTSNGTQALGADNPQLNVTQALINSSEQFVSCQHNLVAYIVKARSPSCGLGTTPLYDESGRVLQMTDGLFVKTLKTAYPDLIIIDEESLSSPKRCQQFLFDCYKLQLSAN